MARRPRDIGTAAETAVVRYLVQHGFPHAERRSLKGSLDQGDITGTPGICWEVKGGEKARTASDGLIASWVDETETERINASADVGILVVQRAAYGPPRAGMWWAVMPLATLSTLCEGFSSQIPAATVRMHLDDAARLLRWAGYGTPLTFRAPQTVPLAGGTL